MKFCVWRLITSINQLIRLIRIQFLQTWIHAAILDWADFVQVCVRIILAGEIWRDMRISPTPATRAWLVGFVHLKNINTRRKKDYGEAGLQKDCGVGRVRFTGVSPNQLGERPISGTGWSIIHDLATLAAWHRPILSRKCQVLWWISLSIIMGTRATDLCQPHWLLTTRKKEESAVKIENIQK